MVVEAAGVPTSQYVPLDADEQGAERRAGSASAGAAAFADPDLNLFVVEDGGDPECSAERGDVVGEGREVEVSLPLDPGDVGLRGGEHASDVGLRELSLLADLCQGERVLHRLAVGGHPLGAGPIAADLLAKLAIRLGHRSFPPLARLADLGQVLVVKRVGDRHHVVVPTVPSSALVATDQQDRDPPRIEREQDADRLHGS